MSYRKKVIKVKGSGFDHYNPDTQSFVKTSKSKVSMAEFFELGVSVEVLDQDDSGFRLICNHVHDYVVDSYMTEEDQLSTLSMCEYELKSWQQLVALHQAKIEWKPAKEEEQSTALTDTRS